MRKIVGSDFDGTWTDNPSLWTITDVIITGNSWENLDIVMERYVGPRKPIMFAPYRDDETTLMKIVSHKARMINEIGVTKFHEDQATQVQMLKLLCPDCEIVKVDSTRTFI